MLRAFADGLIFGEVSGERLPWLLGLHGWQRSHLDFAETLNLDEPHSEHGSRLDAIAIDLPGFGASPAPEEPWGSARYAEAIAPILDQMADEVVVLGHSFGGRVALHLASMFPGRIVGLVLTGVPLPEADLPRPVPPFGYRIVRKLARSGLIGSDRLAASKARHGSRDYREAVGVMRDVLVVTVGESYDEILANLECRVELVWGGFDTAAPLSQAIRASEILANAHLEVIPNADHFIPLNHPNELREAILRLKP